MARNMHPDTPLISSGNQVICSLLIMINHTAEGQFRPIIIYRRDMELSTGPMYGLVLKRHSHQILTTRKLYRKSYSDSEVKQASEPIERYIEVTIGNLVLTRTRPSETKTRTKTWSIY